MVSHPHATNQRLDLSCRVDARPIPHATRFLRDLDKRTEALTPMDSLFAVLVGALYHPWSDIRQEGEKSPFRGGSGVGVGFTGPSPRPRSSITRCREQKLRPHIDTPIAFAAWPRWIAISRRSPSSSSTLSSPNARSKGSSAEGLSPHDSAQKRKPKVWPFGFPTLRFSLRSR
jgi:hypothetical protein